MAGGYGNGGNAGGGNMGGNNGGGANNSGNVTTSQSLAARVNAAAAAGAAAGVFSAVYSRENINIEKPCSLIDYSEEIIIERVFPQPENEEPVEPMYPIEPQETVFLAPEDEIRREYDRVSRVKTLINQGLFFDLSPTELRTVHESDYSFLGFQYVDEVYRIYPEYENDNSLGIYGNLFPFLSPRLSFMNPRFYLYPIMSNFANREAQDDIARNNIDTLRYVMRRSWMRRPDGSAIYQKSTERASIECPFHFISITTNTRVSSESRINLFPRATFFPQTPPAPFIFGDEGVSVQEGMTGEWNGFRFSRLDAYVLGTSHPDYQQWNSKTQQTFAKPLVPVGKVFKDVVHDINMPFYEKEIENLPPGRILDVKVKVGSNFISDEFKRYDGPETSMRDAYTSYRIEKNEEISNLAPAGDRVKFSPYNVSEFNSVVEEKKNQFPMYVNIDFSTHQGSTVCSYIKQSKLENKVLDMMSTSFQSIGVEDRVRDFTYARSGAEDVYAEVLDESVERTGRGRAGRRDRRRVNDATVQGQQRNTVDIMEWLKSVDRPMPYVRNSIRFPLGLEPDQITELESEAANLMFNIRKSRFSVSVRKLIEANLRDFKKLLEGQKAYSETVGYKIEKYSISDGTESLVQRFLILDNDETDRVNFIDTQVKHKQEYIYRIYAYNFVVGSKYTYKKLSVPDSRFQEDERARALVATAQLTSIYDYVEDVGNLGFGPYRPVAYMGVDNTPVFSDVLGKPEVPAEQLGNIGKLTVSHQFNESDRQRFVWLSSINREPSTFGTQSGVMVWTVPVSQGTLSGDRRPSEEEMMAEWTSRQNAASRAAQALDYPKIAEGLKETQNFRHLWDSGDVHVAGVTAPGGRAVEHVGNPRAFGYAPGGGGSLAPFYVDVEVEPYAVFIEVPFFEKTVVMEDAPPVFPQVHFVPFKGETDIVRINLTANSGEYMMEPISFDADDEEMFERILAAQDPADGKIKFKSDDPPVSYEVYRTSKKPTSIRDFADSKIATVYADGTGGVYDDAIEPNTVYYYTFRSMDGSAHVSNPTEIFRCELVSVENGMYLDVTTLSEHDLMEEKVERRQFMKTITIKPALIQKMFKLGEESRNLTGDESLASPPAGGPEIGLFQNGVWDKVYKVRIKSKSSGKMYDINLKFKKKVLDLVAGELGEPPLPRERSLSEPRGDGSEISARPPNNGVGGIGLRDDPNPGIPKP